MCLMLKNYFKEKKARKVMLSVDDLTIDQKIKIQGTNFDRKRKYKQEMFVSMKNLYLSGKATIDELAEKYNMNAATIRYNIDDGYRAQYNSKRKKGTHAVGQLGFDNRVAYKRELISTKKIKVASIVEDLNNNANV